jgi:hypothetical protein
MLQNVVPFAIALRRARCIAHTDAPRAVALLLQHSEGLLTITQAARAVLAWKHSTTQRRKGVQ